jgi:PAS domain-containing protein
MLGEDIDLNEIFADYFINEFEDPLNAYTNSMANYNGAAAAVALAQKQQQVNISMDMSVQSSQQNPVVQTLPTGGIKTAFHSASSARPQQHHQQQQQQQFTNNAPPVAKKLRTEDQAPNFNPSSIPVPKAAGPVIGRGAISGRLGFAMVGGQLALPNQHQQQYHQQQQQYHQQQVMAPAPTPQGIPGHVAPQANSEQVSGGGISLPVGVGIRLGGIGGVAPAMANSAARGGHTTLWGGPTAMAAGAGVMSEHAIAERRQRNREHAKRSRVRKKFMLESMQEEVRALQKQNVELRMLIQEKIPEHAQTIISECCSKNTLFSDVEDVGKVKGNSLEKADFNLIESLTSGQQNFVLSDPRLPDNPIVYASPGFFVLTGYTQDQVLGRNCRFLQGPGTDPRSVDIIRKAVASGADATTCILNYKADGTPFWNQFFVAALRDADNCIVNYVREMSFLS